MPPGAETEIKQHLDEIGHRITVAAESAGRAASDVQLIAVSKTFAADLVREAAAAGQRAFGENRVQEGLDKIGVLADLALDWHLIGHLQSNKARKAVASFGWIHSIDSVDLLKKIDAAALEMGRKPRVLVQVDLAGEATKHGVPEADLEGVVQAALESKAAELAGFMIVPPIPTDAEDSRPWFQQLRAVRDGFVGRGVPAARLAHLSMGMSHDFEIAIAEGATMVRIGTAIFGHRVPPAAAP